MQLWILLSLLAALLLSLTNILTKKAASTLDEYSLAWARNAFSIPWFWAILFFSGLPAIDPLFWIVILIMLPIEIIIAVLFFKAIKVSPLSLVIPFNAFSVFFIGIGAFFILGESLSIEYLISIVLLIVGVYLISQNSSNKGLLNPFRHLLKEKGPIFMVLATVFFGINVPLGKLAISLSSVYFYTAVFFTLFVLFFTPIFLLKSKDGLKKVFGEVKQLIQIGILNSLFLITGLSALSLGVTAVVNAIGGTNILITVVLSGKMLKEKNIKQRLIAALFMTAGAVLIILNSN